MSTRQPGTQALVNGVGADPAGRAGEPAYRLVAPHALARPDAPAVVSAGTTLSYADLVAAANDLAAALHERGVGPGDRVVVSLPRTADAVVALLGVAQTGAAYAPLDPALSDDRLRRLLGDIRPAAVLGADLPRLARLCAYGIGLDPDEAAQRCLSPVQPAGQHSTVDEFVRPEQPAFLAYAPDSAGTPTGVLIAHRALTAVVAALVRRCDLGPRSRVLLADPRLSTVDVYAVLAAGATVVLPGPDATESLAALADRHGVTDVVTASLAMLPASAPPTLATVVVTGDPGPAALVRRWAEGRRLLRTYAPAVTGLACAAAEYGPDDSASLLGRPLPGSRLYVLDDDLAQQPTGAVGELYVAGSALPLGYLNRPELTAQRFQPDPFAPGLMVRTGVLAYRHPDGRLARLDRDAPAAGIGLPR